MKWFRVVPRDNVPGAFLDLDDADFKGFNPSRLYEGKPIEDWPAEVTFSASENEPGERADDALVTFNMVPLYSKRLQEAILAAGITDFQFLPCRVINGKGEDVEGYAVANVLAIRYAFAPEHAKVLYQDETRRPVFTQYNIKVIRQDALFAEKVQGCHAFRLPQIPFLYLYVSQVFRKAFSTIKATGLSFRAVEVV